MPQPDPVLLRQLVLAFCHFPLEAQMVTIDRHGMPVGRTLAADMQPDWTVDMLTYPFFGRVKHLRRNPQMLLIWVEAKQATLFYPRAVFARGKAEILEGEPVVTAYNAKVAKGGAPPHVVSVDMKIEEPRVLQPEEVRRRMCLVRVTVDEIRAEGFSTAGDPLEANELLRAQTWRPERSAAEPHG